MSVYTHNIYGFVLSDHQSNKEKEKKREFNRASKERNKF